MRIKQHALASTAIALLVSGCSVFPQPDDIMLISAPNATVAIVQHIRCEARSAMEDQVISYLRDVKLGTYNNYSASYTQQAADIISKYENFNGKLHDFIEIEYNDLLKKQKINKLNDVEKTLYDFTNAAIAFDFTFDMTNLSNNASTLNFTNPFVGGGLTLNNTASQNISKENTRNFKVSDYFYELIKEIHQNDCDSEPNSSNTLYPIYGKIGIENSIGTFVRLNEVKPLDDNAIKTTSSTQFADTLVFNTQISGTINPTITISSVGHFLHVATVGDNLTLTRTDKDTVIVALALPPTKAAATTTPNTAPAGSPPKPTNAKESALQNLATQKSNGVANSLQLLINSAK